MKHTSFQSGWYADATPSGEWAVLHSNSHIQTSRGRVELPGENTLFLVCGEYGGQLCLAGQGGGSGVGWLWNGSTWKAVSQSTYGTSPCAFGPLGLYVSGLYEDTPVGKQNIRIYDALTFAQLPGLAQEVGVRGIALVSPDGVIHGQDAWYGGTLAEYVDLQGVQVGQSFDDGCLIGGKLLEPGNVQFIRAHRDGDRIAVAIWKAREGQAVAHWLTVAEIAALAYPPPPPRPSPPPPSPPPPPPPPEKHYMYRSQEQIFPYLVQRWNELGVPAAVDAVKEQVGIHTDNEMTDLRLKGENGDDAARQRHDDAEAKFRAVQTAAFFRIVGELYWQRGFKDVGLGRKLGGANIEGKATDIVVLKPIDAAGNVADGQVKQFDAMNSNGYPEAKPGWNEIPFNADRTWVEPKNLGDGKPGPGNPPPPPPPSSSFAGAAAALEARIAGLAAQIVEHEKSIVALKAQIGSRVDKPALELDGAKVSFRTENGHFISAQDGGGGVIHTQRPVPGEPVEGYQPGGWETFTVVAR